MASEIKVDTISEKTSAGGVTIDGLTIKDGNINESFKVVGTTPTLTMGDAGAVTGSKKLIDKVKMYRDHGRRTKYDYEKVGYNARISAALLAIFCLATAFMFHLDFSDPMQKISFLKNIGLAGGFLFIVANGTKDWSIDKKKKYVRL